MQAGSILSRDIYYRYIDRNASHQRLVFVSRLCILVGGIIGIIVAVYCQRRKSFDPLAPE